MKIPSRLISLRTILSTFIWLTAALNLSACSSLSSSSSAGAPVARPGNATSHSASASSGGERQTTALPVIAPRTTLSKSGEARMSNQRQDVLMYTLGLLGTGYRFGGKNPEAGLDCSGMVSFIYREATHYPLSGNAASMAKEGRTISMAQIRPGDLVFFNTRGFPHSHVGIFIGEGRFVHAPNSNGKIRVERLDGGYFAKQFEEARTYFD